MLTIALLLWLAPADWPQWRGPHRDGSSAETDWSSMGAGDPLWHAEVGLGYSSMVVREGRLYTAGHDADTKLDRLFCIDATTGDEIWRHQIPAGTHDTFHGGGTLSTPTLAGDRVYFANSEGHAVALDAVSGEPVWDRQLAAEHDIAATTYGFSASPLADDGALFVTLGGIVLSLDPDTGDLRWRSADFKAGTYTNPLPITHAGHPAILLFCGPGVVLLDRDTGAEVARVELKSSSQGSLKASTPLIAGRRVLVSAAYDFGAAMIDLSTDPPGVIWRSRHMRAKVSDVCRYHDRLYGFDESILKCIDLDGNDVWRVRGLGMGALSVAGDRLLVLSSEGELVIADATAADFHELSRRKVLDGGVYWTAPVLSNGLIYCRSSLGGLVCLDHRNQTASGATPAPIAPDVGVDVATLFARHAKAVRPPDGADFSSLRYVGTFASTAQGITAQPMTLDVKDHRWAMTVDMGQYGKIRRACDGEVAWSLDPFYGDELRQGALLDEARETWPVADLTLYPKSVVRGATRFFGQPALAVDVESRGGARRTLYFDPEQDRLIGHEGPDAAMVRLDDYRLLDGLWVPTRVRSLHPETGIEDRLIITAVIRDAAAPDAFDRPIEVIRLLRTPAQIEEENARLRERFAGHLGSYVAGFEPLVGRGVRVEVADGDLRMVIEGREPMVLDEPDDTGRFPIRNDPGLSLRFEPDATDATRSGAILLQRRDQPTEDRLPRRSDG